MPRILIAECKQEVSSFNPAPSRYEDFRVVRGAAFLDHHHNVREEVGGALSVFEKDTRLTIIPTFGASGNTSVASLRRRASNGSAPISSPT